MSVRRSIALFVLLMVSGVQCMETGKGLPGRQGDSSGNGGQGRDHHKKKDHDSEHHSSEGDLSEQSKRKKKEQKLRPKLMRTRSQRDRSRPSSQSNSRVNSRTNSRCSSPTPLTVYGEIDIDTQSQTGLYLPTTTKTHSDQHKDQKQKTTTETTQTSVSIPRPHTPPTSGLLLQVLYSSSPQEASGVNAGQSSHRGGFQLSDSQKDSDNDSRRQRGKGNSKPSHSSRSSSSSPPPGRSNRQSDSDREGSNRGLTKGSMLSDSQAVGGFFPSQSQASDIEGGFGKSRDRKHRDQNENRDQNRLSNLRRNRSVRYSGSVQDLLEVVQPGRRLQTMPDASAASESQSSMSMGCDSSTDTQANHQNSEDQGQDGKEKKKKNSHLHRLRTRKQQRDFMQQKGAMQPMSQVDMARLLDLQSDEQEYQVDQQNFNLFLEDPLAALGSMLQYSLAQEASGPGFGKRLTLPELHFSDEDLSSLDLSDFGLNQQSLDQQSPTKDGPRKFDWDKWVDKTNSGLLTSGQLGDTRGGGDQSHSTDDEQILTQRDPFTGGIFTKYGKQSSSDAELQGAVGHTASGGSGQDSVLLYDPRNYDFDDDSTDYSWVQGAVASADRKDIRTQRQEQTDRRHGRHHHHHQHHESGGEQHKKQTGKEEEKSKASSKPSTVSKPFALGELMKLSDLKKSSAFGGHHPWYPEVRPKTSQTGRPNQSQSSGSSGSGEEGSSNKEPQNPDDSSKPQNQYSDLDD